MRSHTREKATACTAPHHLQCPALREGQKAFFLSDLHLGFFRENVERKREKEWVQWLKGQEQKMTLLFLVGDVFDTWFEYREVVPKGFVRLLGYLANLSSKGVQVHYLVGNHDLLVGHYMETELGISVYRQPISLLIGDTRLYLAHGDGLGRGDTSYKMLKSVLSSLLFKTIFRAIHPDIGLWAFRAVSRSRVYHKVHLRGKKESGHHRLLDYVKGLAQRNEGFYHHYVLAHTHLAHQEELSGGAVYTNLGDGIHTPSCGMLDADGRFTLARVAELDTEKSAQRCSNRGSLPC